MSSYVGDAIAQIRQARNTRVDTNFSEKLAQIQQTAQAQETEGGDTEKASGVGFGALAGIKGAYEGFKKIKSKYQAYKDKLQEAKDKLQNKEKNQKEGEDEDADDEDIADGDPPELSVDDANSALDEVFGTSNETPTPELSPDEAQNALDELFGTGEEETQDLGSLIKNGITDGRQFLNKIFNRGQEVIDNYANEPNITSTELAPKEMDIPDTELGGGRVPTNEPYGTGEGDIEMTGNVTETPNWNLETRGGRQGSQLDDIKESYDVGKMETIPEEDEEDENAYDEADPMETIENADDVGDAIENAVSKGTSAISDAVGDGTTTVASTIGKGVAVADDIGDGVAGAVADGAEEAVGTALDATGVLAPLGIFLNVLGIVGAGAGVVAGVVQTDNAESKENTDENQAEEDKDNQKAQPADYAGAFAGKASSALSRFM